MSYLTNEAGNPPGLCPEQEAARKAEGNDGYAPMGLFEPPKGDPMRLAGEIAREHVDWFLEMVRPLLVDHFIHGYKHGLEEEKR